jgi:hypothetical protein
LEDDIQSPAELPYFEGDFWPNVMEDNIRELEEEEEARRRVSLTSVPDPYVFGPSDPDPLITSTDPDPCPSLFL